MEQNRQSEAAVKPGSLWLDPKLDMTLGNERLLQEYIRLWWGSQGDFPTFDMRFTNTEQAENEKLLDRQVGALIHELKHIPAADEERARLQARLRPGMVEFARRALCLEERHIAFIEDSGLAAGTGEFARMARSFDPGISAEDIYQAGRNVMTANLIQLLLGLPAVVTPSIFAYSMLYPYTDNYLDDASVPGKIKKDFNLRFRGWLEGDTAGPANRREERIFNLVQMIPAEWDRERYPQVYESLLAIHTAQARSLELVAPGASPFERDVLGISFEKGGTSVLADGYLVAGSLSEDQARLLYGYGAFTQLMDDLEDIEQDRREGRMTVFTQTAARWPLDGLTNRLFSFGRAIFARMVGFDPQAAAALGELITRCVDPILIDIVARSSGYYSRGYLGEMERHFAFRFAAIRRQRARLTRQRVDLGKLIEMVL